MGVELVTKYQERKMRTVMFDGKEYNVCANCTVELNPTTAKILATNENGEPCFFKNNYGKGTVYVLTYPLEGYLLGVSNAMDNENYHEIHSTFAKEKPVYSKYKNVCITNHSDIYVAINYSDKFYNKPINTVSFKKIQIL